MSIQYTQEGTDATVTVLMGAEGLEIVTHDVESDLKDKISSSVSSCSSFLESSSSDLSVSSSTSFSDCMVGNILNEVTKCKERANLERELKGGMSERLRNYTCSDPTMNTSEAENTSSFFHKGREITVDTMFSSPQGSIWLLSDFITNEECEVLRNHGLSTLQEATVTGEDGVNVVSEYRRANQSSSAIAWSPTSLLL